MRKDIADLVYPVISYALDLHERIERNDLVNIAEEQAALRELLLPSPTPHTDDESDERAAALKIPPEYLGAAEGNSGASASFLGILYALVCWLDEKFVAHPICVEAWGRQPLELLFYGRNDRDWKFWEQAALARSLPSPDALEAFYLCAMLGFRGEYRETPERLTSWTSAAASQIDEALPAWRAPASLEPVVHVPPLSGVTWLRRMLFAAATMLLCLIPAAAFFVARKD